MAKPHALGLQFPQLLDDRLVVGLDHADGDPGEVVLRGVLPQPLDLPCGLGADAVDLPGNGRVELSGELPHGRWHLRYRQGGESLQLPGRGRRDLKRLLNELRVPAFVRPRLPLLFEGDELMAVANLTQASGFEAKGLRLRWSPPIGAQGLSW